MAVSFETLALAKKFAGGGGGGTVTVDSALSETSTNPVQNKVLTPAVLGAYPDGEVSGGTINVNAVPMPVKSLDVTILGHQATTVGTAISPENPQPIVCIDKLNIISGDNILNDSYGVSFPYSGTLSSGTYTAVKNADGSYTVSGSGFGYAYVPLTYDDALGKVQPITSYRGGKIYTDTLGANSIGVSILLEDGTTSALMIDYSDYSFTVPDNAVGLKVSINQFIMGTVSGVYKPVLSLNPNPVFTPCTGLAEYGYDWSAEGGKTWNASLNAVIGELEISGKALNGKDMTWTLVNTYSGSFSMFSSPISNDYTSVPYSDKFAVDSYISMGQGGTLWGFGVFNTPMSKELRVCIPDTITTSDGAAAWMEENDPVFYYTMASPVSYQLTGHSVNLRDGANMFTTDAAHKTVVETQGYDYETGQYVTITTEYEDVLLSMLYYAKPVNPSDIPVVPDVSIYLEKNQGVVNAGKFMVVGQDGVVVPVEMQAWTGGSY